MAWRVIGAVFAGLLAAAACVGEAAAGGAEQDPAITVIGNRHIGADMVRSFFHAGPDGHYDATERDAALKRLYATGLFADVKISHEGNRILVIVVENPTIGVVAFEGNKKLKDDELKKQLQSKAGGPLSRETVQSDVIHIFEIKEGEKLGVRDIVFTGNSAFSQIKLRGVVKTGVTNLLSFAINNDIYDPDRIENDKDLIRRFYLAHGYADVRVSSSGRYDADKNGAVVAFKVDEGPQYRFGKVDIQSRLKAVDGDALRSNLHTRRGEIYDAVAVDKSVEDLAMALARSGEPFASVIPRIERHSDRRLIDISYRIEQGKRIYIERIQISGDRKTRDEVIRREFDVGEGDAYNRSLIDRGERHLKALGYSMSPSRRSRPGISSFQAATRPPTAFWAS